MLFQSNKFKCKWNFSWLNDIEKIHWLIYLACICPFYQFKDSLPHEEREETKAYDKTGERFHRTDRLKVENGYLLPLKSLLQDVQCNVSHQKVYKILNIYSFAWELFAVLLPNTKNKTPPVYFTIFVLAIPEHIYKSAHIKLFCRKRMMQPCISWGMVALVLRHLLPSSELSQD